MNLACLVLSLTLVAPPPGELPAPPSVGGAMLLAEGDPIAAAGVFEHLWNDTRDPVALLWAGLSRLRAGDAAHAVAYLGQALTLELPPRLTASAEHGLAQARRATRLVAIELRLHGAGPVLLALTRVGRAAPALTFQLAPHPGAQMLPISLDRGTWLVELRRGSLTLARTVEVDAHSAAIVLDEAVPPTPPPPRIRSLRLAGLITGGNMSILGAGLFAFGVTQSNHAVVALSTHACEPTTCRPFLAEYATWRSAGAGLLGAGLGLSTGALGTLFKSPRARRIAWSVDLGLGGALVSASFLLGGLAGAAANRANQAGMLDSGLTVHLTRHAAAAAMLGLGVGLVTSASLGLVLDHSDARRRARLRAHVTPGGLAFSGQF